MLNQNHSDTQESIYLERSGKRSRELSEKLLQSPDDPLDANEFREVEEFEKKLCDYQLGNGVSIEELIRKRGGNVQMPRFFADAFLKGHVHVDGLEGEIRQCQTPEDVYSWLARSANNQSVSEENFLSMALQSGQYYRTEMAQALLKDEKPKDQILDSMPIAIDPKKLLEYTGATLEARHHLIDLRAHYHANAHGLEGAKRAFIDIYTKVINGAIASDVVTLKFLVQQAELIGDEDLAEAAYNTLPNNLRRAAVDTDRSHALAKRLDYIKNGIGYDEQGRASAVDKAVFLQSDVEQETSLETPVYTPEQREILRNTQVNKEVIQLVLKQVIADAGLLSAEDESNWYVGRGQRASDGLCQVVYQPTKNTFEFNRLDYTLRTPNASRTLYELMTVGSHELTHINQSLADDIFGQLFRIGILKGRRIAMIRETGANIVQRQLEQQLFGESKPVAYAYAKAIKELEAGKEIFDVTKAFYDEKLRAGNGMGAAAAAKEAADRVLRLMISDGTNSQPMSYAEENIMSSELADAPQEVRQRATLVTCLDLDDQVRLHPYGLLGDMNHTTIDWIPLLLNRLQPLIDRALS